MDLIKRGYELISEGKVARALVCFGKVGELSPKGYLELSNCYQNGFGVDADEYLARKYYKLAMRQAKRIHERNIRALRGHRCNRDIRGRKETRRYSRVREYLYAA